MMDILTLLKDYWTRHEVAKWVTAHFVPQTLYRVDLEGVQGDIDAAEADIATLETDVAALEFTVTDLSEQVAIIDGDLAVVEAAVPAHAALTAAHGATGAVVGTTNTQTLTNKTLDSPTLSGTINMTGVLHSVSVGLADDTATSFVPPAIGGMLLISCTNSANVWGLANYRAGAYMTAMIDGTALTFTSGVLAGTTGVDGQVTVSQSGSNIYIENRLGGARTFVFLFIN
jgi:hypothetical protein